MDLITALALACLIAAAIIAGFQKAWPLVLMSAAFALLVATGSGLIHT